MKKRIRGPRLQPLVQEKSFASTGRSYLDLNDLHVTRCIIPPTVGRCLLIIVKVTFLFLKSLIVSMFLGTLVYHNFV